MKNNNHSKFDILREKVEKLLKEKPLNTDEQIPDFDLFQLIHELEVHKIELELQNENLGLARSAAQEAAEKYAELYDFAPSGYVTLSKEGKIVEINLRGANMLGIERSALISNAFGCFVSDDTKPIFILFLENAFKSNTKETCEVSLSTIDKSTKYVHLTGINSQNRKYCDVTLIDITKRKIVEGALKESENLYRSLFENMLNGFAYCQMQFDENNRPLDYTYLAVNKAFEMLTGLTDVIGKKVSEVVPGILETDPELFEIYGRISLSGKPERFEFFIHSLQIWFLFSVYSPKYGFFVTVFDVITEQKKAAAEIQKSNEIREQLLRHMTEIRENERAVISREIHDQLGQSMTALKLDMNWLQGNVTMNSEIKEKLSGMVALITATISDVQRISSELRPGILDDLGLAAAIEWYAEEFENRTKIHVIMNLDEVQTNSNQKNLALFRVLQEALTNVIRHAKAKTVKITLHENDQHIFLEIIDDGIGIAPEKIKSIRSLGLMGMQDRVKQAGGTMEILGGEVPGTIIRICIPVEETLPVTLKK